MQKGITTRKNWAGTSLVFRGVGVGIVRAREVFGVARWRVYDENQEGEFSLTHRDSCRNVT